LEAIRARLAKAMEYLDETAQQIQGADERRDPWSGILGAKARLTSEFGMRSDPFTGKPDHHGGVDIAAPRGTEIRAWRDGVVTGSGWEGGYGRTVTVKHSDGTVSRYAHNEKNLVRVGDKVQQGETLGLVGSSGRSTGPHIHFEIRRNGVAVDPMPYLKNGGYRMASSN
jgi:murein DD-endopeptidase MepM/ murein hydrolase activator NlpD